MLLSHVLHYLIFGLTVKEQVCTTSSYSREKGSGKVKMTTLEILTIKYCATLCTGSETNSMNLKPETISPGVDTELCGEWFCSGNTWLLADQTLPPPLFYCDQVSCGYRGLPAVILFLFFYNQQTCVISFFSSWDDIICVSLSRAFQHVQATCTVQ